ncbi:putative retrotransposon gag domain-containing protein [Helianthus annuus]|nr:putative retrotransposon gag domain-containing protein [Helianthus annuus]KAJ0553802.1 putative retrotransposon gag domain-containing protein [Helianthus annuus]KAJ0719461.1 putative retrotransposon gag domain-containing protein [Helianthus annuus]
MDHTSRPPAQTYPGSNVFQDQGSLGRQSWRSSEIYEGDFIPMQTVASSGPTITPYMSYPRYPSGIPTSSQPGGNNFNTSVDTNYGFMQDAGINQAMARELQKLKDMISSIPGVVKPIPKIPKGSHIISRFAPPIYNAEIPTCFQTPNMKLYDGTIDPKEHVAQYREMMEINPTPERSKEACLYKGFGSILTRSALKWLLSLPPYSITSFSHLVNLFNNQFSCSRTFERLTSDLYRITQACDESLRDYVTKFGRESLEIPNLDITTAVEAFRMRLQKDSPFYDGLFMTPCRKLDEVRFMALRFNRLEDDKRIQDRLIGSSKHEKQGSFYKNNRSKPYSKHDNQNVHAVEQEEDEEYPRISEYCFSVDNSELMLALQNLREKAR